jgi:hypothetical protein
MSTNLPVIKLDRGIHAMHLFYRVDRERWARLPAGQSERSRTQLESLCAANANPSHPRLMTYANVGAKADLAFILLAAGLTETGQMHRDLEACFPAGTLQRVFSYLSVTELSEYMPTEEDNRRLLVEQEKLSPESEAFQKRMAELRERDASIRTIPPLPRNAGVGGDGLLSDEQTAQRGGQLVSPGFHQPQKIDGRPRPGRTQILRARLTVDHRIDRPG